MTAVDADVRDEVAGQHPLRLLDSLGKGRTPLCRVRSGQGQRDDVAPPLEQRAGPWTAGCAAPFISRFQEGGILRAFPGRIGMR